MEAIAELGIEMAFEFPKPLTDEVVRAADVVVTMGCGDVCPRGSALTLTLRNPTESKKPATMTL